MYKVFVCKNYGPFEFEVETYEDAVALAIDKWYGSGVWDVRVFKDRKEIDISEHFKNLPPRPIYC